MSEPILALREVSKTYNLGRPNAVSVLNGASLTLERGESRALVAPSGAGKSTLLHVAGLLDTADSGVIALSGTDMARASDRRRTEARRREIGFVYQFHHLLPEFTAAENIVLPQLANGVPAGEAQAHAEDLLERVGLKTRARHRPAEMSGGEQQRVAFCRALANRPRLLLADEPTGNLDPETSDRVFGVLADLVRETGLATLVATHNHDLARRLGAVVRLEGGKLVEAVI